MRSRLTRNSFELGRQLKADLVLADNRRKKDFAGLEKKHQALHAELKITRQQVEKQEPEIQALTQQLRAFDSLQASASFERRVSVRILDEEPTVSSTREVHPAATVLQCKVESLVDRLKYVEEANDNLVERVKRLKLDTAVTVGWTAGDPEAMGMIDTIKLRNLLTRRNLLSMPVRRQSVMKLRSSVGRR
ncbi:hypothetical protein BV25DRAFT_1435796 [Artomyces pyxidatus]|uniref:Uncharacterized protein n=1 Tax=Artomyces pyxidatus TaxID=48021 RepID=A0ACB8SLX7_9AGAM|nr:hypothetical protein BV25DRAFT_1435796 [Artomyces pyxidatus]